MKNRTIPLIFIFKILITYLLVECVAVYYRAHVRVGTQESLFSPPTMWVAESELRSSDSVAGAFFC